ncbi:YeeE/YedE family protein [Aestuariivirga sp.]|uniref:YeeE/YedE family protein n=1 Tax=Aestuariivirga sp. TaxID=2650926 RepID=UPI003593FE94
MDMTGVIEVLGEDGTNLAIGLLVGLVFGAFAQQSRFCLRAAVLEFAHGSLGQKLSIWLLAFGAAVTGTQLLATSGMADLAEARQLASPQSLSGAAIGGLMFGAGMVLARGCASRLLVLSATGNLRALLSGLVFAVVAQASLRGFLQPVREWMASRLTTGQIGGNDLIAFTGVSQSIAIAFAAMWLLAGVAVAIRARAGTWRSAAAIGVGLSIPLAWWLTSSMSQQAFDPVQVESVTFTGPSADTLMLFLSQPGTLLDFDVGLVPGVFLGSFLAAFMSRELVLQGFHDGQSMRRYLAGAALMGFGGMLAGGCAVGAGVTGASVFAVTAWITLGAIWIAATLTDRVLDPVKTERLVPVMGE